MTEPRTAVLPVRGSMLHTATFGDDTPGLVLLHDGLGSVDQWRTIPSDLAERTGLTVLAYDRSGHGESLPVPTAHWPVDWLAREAEVLAGLIEAVGATDPVLVGHSDGGSIAALHAARAQVASPVVLLAAHSWVEQAAVDAITGMRARRELMVRGLSRSHAHPEALFEAWSGAWTSPEFSAWDIRPLLGAIEAPTLVLQGERDEFATDLQAEATAAAIGHNATCRILPKVAHLMHHRHPELLVDQVGDFIEAHR